MVLYQCADICQGAAEQYGGLLFASDEQPRTVPSIVPVPSSTAALPAFKDLVVGLAAEDDDDSPSTYLKASDLNHVDQGEKPTCRMIGWLDSVDEFRENVRHQM